MRETAVRNEDRTNRQQPPTWMGTLWGNKWGDPSDLIESPSVIYGARVLLGALVGGLVVRKIVRRVRRR